MHCINPVSSGEFQALYNHISPGCWFSMILLKKAVSLIWRFSVKFLDLNPISSEIFVCVEIVPYCAFVELTLVLKTSDG